MRSPTRPDNPVTGIGPSRAWVHAAIAGLEREAAAAADTPLIPIGLPRLPGITLFLKDESAHATGSLKHRLARSLFLYALCNGRLVRGQGAIDASSGSTAISEAWFARLLGIAFTAVVPGTTAPGKIRELRRLGARCEFAAAGEDCAAIAQALAAREGLCFLDQFGLAERATDWRGNNNIAESIIAQMRGFGRAEPAWVVCGAGTGGTSATIGRYLRYQRLATRLCVAEPRASAFVHGWRAHRAGQVWAGEPAAAATLIEGIGRPRIEPGFVFDVVDTVVEVDDATSIAHLGVLERALGRRYGGSSGTNLAACLVLAQRMHANGESGSIVSLLCDRGERYAETLFDGGWLRANGLGTPDPEGACPTLHRERP